MESAFLMQGRGSKEGDRNAKEVDVVRVSWRLGARDLPMWRAGVGDTGNGKRFRGHHDRVGAVRRDRRTQYPGACNKSLARRWSREECMALIAEDEGSFRSVRAEQRNPGGWRFGLA